jgi:lipoyl(octanoyl) transferase
MKIVDLGITEFTSAFVEQERLVPLIEAGEEPETLLLTEHHSVYTSGRRGSPDNILDASVRPVFISRGGDVTWHGPGQLVGYPLVNLGTRGRDLHRYLRFLEEVAIRVCAGFGVTAFRRPGLTGVWTRTGKIASIGVGVRRWVTMHGFAFNVNPDPAPFGRINPCGIPGCRVAALAPSADRATGIEEVSKMFSTLLPPLLEEMLPSDDCHTIWIP